MMRPVQKSSINSSMTDRLFTKEYLARAGVPTVDLQARALQEGRATDLPDLQTQLLREASLVIHSYAGWENAVRGRLQLPRAESPKVILNDWQQRTETLADLGREGNFEQQLEQSRVLAEDMLAEHDRRMHIITDLMSRLYREQGETVLGKLLEQVMDPAMLDPEGDKSFKQRVEVLIGFTRCHLLPFTVTEDDEKVTFRPDVCPSGARLIQQGAYQGDQAAALVSSSALSWGRDHLPVYCCHEPAAEMAAVRKFGAPLFLVVPSADLEAGPCVTYMYKRPQDIPRQYFERLNMAEAADLIARG